MRPVLFGELLGRIVRLSRLVAVLATALGLIFFALGQAVGLSFWHNLLFAIGIWRFNKRYA